MVAPADPAASASVTEAVEGAGEGGSGAEGGGEKGRRRKRVARVGGVLLLVAGLVAGVGQTVVTVRGADRDAGAPVWEFPKDGPADADEADRPSGLAGSLVPYGTFGWSRGPDLGEFGSDVSLGGAQATALRKESLRGLPRTQRRQMEEQVDKARITGMAMRSYVHREAGSVFTASIVLSEMENRSTVRGTSTFQNELLDSLGVFRDGPKIRGYKNARCFLTPKDEDTELDSLYCSAYQGSVLITVIADGVRPLNSDGVARLLRVQLDRIAEPGKAV
ncbi:hypothetical protein [Streptomyces sp. YS415]|uniref:hypothetical protein n=1 Tax=Streptomyces sp. YS415 TaxID=2944806 RepID=UPI002021CE4B|nr:hypothetical protein [Streptomyces sp. YS415]MCL7425095.1 hypothetical protein [Streptomyces sp. YS415]